jgi:L-lysine exporter family protein LysE/ArgO
MLFLILIQAVGLGLGAAVPIGPVNVEIARRTLRHGLRAGFLLGCGAVTIDVSYAVVVSLLMKPVLVRPTLELTLSLAGGSLLIFLAVQCFRGARTEWKKRLEPIPATAPTNGHTHYLTGLAMTALNPMTLAVWFVAVPGFVVQITSNPARDLPIVCLGVFAGAFGWVCFFSGLMTLVRKLGNRSWFAVADTIGGLMLLAFGLIAILRAIL